MLKKLLQLQSELKAPKGQYNSFGKYSYRSCEDIVEAVKPIASKLGLVLTISDTIELIGDRFYIKATATITDIETGKEKSTTAYAREPEEKKGMDEAQITGATSSYARKYALNGLLAIDDNKDPDANEQPKQKSKTEPKGHNAFDNTGEKISKEEKNELLMLITRKGASLGEILKYYQITGIQNLSKAQYRHCKETLEKKPDKETGNDLQEPKK